MVCISQLHSRHTSQPACSSCAWWPCACYLLCPKDAERALGGRAPRRATPASISHCCCTTKRVGVDDLLCVCKHQTGPDRVTAPTSDDGVRRHSLPSARRCTGRGYGLLYVQHHAVIWFVCLHQVGVPICRDRPRLASRARELAHREFDVGREALWMSVTLQLQISIVVSRRFRCVLCVHSCTIRGRAVTTFIKGVKGNRDTACCL